MCVHSAFEYFHFFFVEEIESYSNYVLLFSSISFKLYHHYTYLYYVYLLQYNIINQYNRARLRERDNETIQYSCHVTTVT